MAQLLEVQSVITPVEVFMQMGNLTKKDYENWRFGRIPYLEGVVKCNLSKANRILRIIRLHGEDLGFRPFKTLYRKWGKGVKIQLRFSKTGNWRIEELWSTSLIAPESQGSSDATEALRPIPWPMWK